MSSTEPTVYFPNHDPRPFLAEQVAGLRNEAEQVDAVHAHVTVNAFEDFTQRFIKGEASAELVCLYSIIIYEKNRDTLDGTKAGQILEWFPETFSQYVYIEDQALVYLQEGAQQEVHS